MENTSPENFVAIEIAERIAARNSACAGALTAFSLFCLIWLTGYAWLSDAPPDEAGLATSSPDDVAARESLPDTAQVHPKLTPSRSASIQTATVSPATWQGKSFFTHATSREYLADESAVRPGTDEQNLVLSFEAGPAVEPVRLPSVPPESEAASLDSPLPAPQVPVASGEEVQIEDEDRSATTAQVPEDAEVLSASDRKDVDGLMPSFEMLNLVEFEPSTFATFLDNQSTSLPGILFPSHFGKGHWYEPQQEHGEFVIQTAPSEELPSLPGDDTEAIFRPHNWTMTIVSEYAVGPRLLEIFGDVRGRWARSVSVAEPEDTAFANRDVAPRWFTELQFGEEACEHSLMPVEKAIP
ncbi:MAG: hypothetical protein H8E37_03420 [Planctomycetes bacterium]|nr:hypothetical protein [Planctomycetota bacterium]